MTLMLDGTDLSSRPKQIEACTAAIRRGQVVVAPDEGLYSLIADAFSERAVTRLREIKGRADSPLSVLIGYPGTADGVAARIPEFARDLMSALWPGPLTLILRQQPSLAWPLSAPGVAVRMPLHPVLLAIVREVGPTAATSANAAGYPPARAASAAVDQLDDRVGVGFDAGALPSAPRSTVIDATGAHPVIMREGAFPADRIEQLCPGLDIRSQ